MYKYIGMRQAPGGCVLHVYDAHSGELLRICGVVPGPGELEGIAADVGGIIRDFEGREVILRVFDGDTGQPMTLSMWDGK